jgi:hypothetical protein
MRCFRTRNLLLSKKCVPLHCVFHSIRFKVNKGWSTAVLLFLCLYLISSILKYSFHSYLIVYHIHMLRGYVTSLKVYVTDMRKYVIPV